jgi:hypothetical protein
MSDQQKKQVPEGEDHWQNDLQNIDAIMFPGEEQGPYDNDQNAMLNGPRSTAACIGVISMIGVMIGLQFPFLFPKSAPYMATPGRKVRSALEFVLKQQNNNINTILKSVPSSSIGTDGLKQQQHERRPVFVDMGSGDGQAVYEAGKLGYDSIGIEYNWTLYMFSSLRRRLFWPSQIQCRTKFLRQDFHSYNLCRADVVMIFAIPRTMPVLGAKIQSECAPGTNILAYRFGIPLLQRRYGNSDNHTNDNDNNKDEVRLNADLIYDREDMRIYRMN